MFQVFNTSPTSAPGIKKLEAGGAGSGPKIGQKNRLGTGKALPSRGALKLARHRQLVQNVTKGPATRTARRQLEEARLKHTLSRQARGIKLKRSEYMRIDRDTKAYDKRYLAQRMASRGATVNRMRSRSRAISRTPVRQGEALYLAQTQRHLGAPKTRSKSTGNPLSLLKREVAKEKLKRAKYPGMFGKKAKLRTGGGGAGASTRKRKKKVINV